VSELVAKPKTLDHVQAAAVPLAAMTAWQGLIDQGGLQTGQGALIHGGAGGVGHFAIQLAKAKGAHVLTTVAGQDIDFVRGLGAGQAIDYKAQRFEDVARGIDLVFDLIAGETQDRSWSVLRRGGMLISTPQKPDDARARDFGVRAANYMAQPNPGKLREIRELIDRGKVRIHVDKVQQAHRWLEHDHVRGKIVLQVA
jgi:NADPH:quinone reductase-like Zn-dependent oxidoreductase